MPILCQEIRHAYGNCPVGLNISQHTSFCARHWTLQRHTTYARNSFTLPNTPSNDEYGSNADSPSKLALLLLLKFVVIFHKKICSPTSVDELRTLLAILDLYGRASNARVNRGKTAADPLSGRAHTAWIHVLQNEGISSWLDWTSSIGTTYLGYPLSSSKAQLQALLDKLLQEIRAHAQFLTQRSLSKMGRALVANSLLLARVWHCIRILPVPLSFLASLRSTISAFLTHKNFPRIPRISFSSLTRPKSEGSLGVLDPIAQHCALQLRWLFTLLEHDQVAKTPSFALSILQHCVTLECQVSRSEIPFLFPKTRPNTILCLEIVR